MELEIGAILNGKVTVITKFGAFVALPGGRSGLVHISEVAYSFVNDVNEFLTVGQEVKVKVIGMEGNNRINLSIKQTLPPPPASSALPTGAAAAGPKGTAAKAAATGATTIGTAAASQGNALAATTVTARRARLAPRNPRPLTTW